MTLTRDKLVERIARALSYPPDRNVDTVRTLLADLDRAGLCIVPREPTEGMQVAGASEHVGVAYAADGTGRCLTPSHVYRAMIAAAGEG